jgi:ABC-type dipeptide/oligopeptide/nickel transport system permease component
MGVTVLYGLLIVLANLAVDLLQAWLDPRVRLR